MDENIPKYFFQIWINNQNTIPEPLINNFNFIKNDNLDFECQMFNNNDCIEFLKINYGEEIINAYNNLIPGAYKADLTRYCILYTRGGIYLDAKMMPMNDFKLKNVIDKEYFVRDGNFEGRGRGVYNAFMICKKNNPILLEVINNIVDHVKTKYYGETCLCPTGPFLLKKKFTEEQINNFDYELTNNGDSIFISKMTSNYDLGIIKVNKELCKVQSLHSGKYYAELWNERKIYL